MGTARRDGYSAYDPVAAGEVREMLRQINLTLDEVEARLRTM
jgi:hypothetical protein